MTFTLSDDLAVALVLAAEADLVALDRYRAQDLDVQLKPDRSQVTDADTRVEQIIREHLAAARPDDSILGEEFGTEGSSNRQWIIDPIDGTSNFVRGVPIWGALISLVIDGVPEVGVVSAPALGRRWWAATGHGAWLQQEGGEPRRLQVSGITEFADATLSYNSIKHWDQYGRLDQLIALSREVGRARAFGDLWSYMLLAEGAIDIAGEFDVKPWDIAALVPIVREAGGRVTDVDGTDALDTLSVIATNGLLHDGVLERLRPS
ncbi:inositol monophosphatase family protein [Pseudolysinimonas sp.]|uniref:inositol monophosphatase family protein n=1 Tax=Pseudolysinimonas sp. TaxID=2680009 RepID=UPI00286BF348|nr:inositol monophosphatase family protein [Pseudolysinimonas sp.]